MSIFKALLNNEPSVVKGAIPVGLGGAWWFLNLPWDKVVGMLGAAYYIHLMAGWWWDHFWRGLAIRKGWYHPDERAEMHWREREFQKEQKRYYRELKKEEKRRG